MGGSGQQLCCLSSYLSEQREGFTLLGRVSIPQGIFRCFLRLLTASWTAQELSQKGSVP